MTMLRPVADGIAIVACSTCRHGPDLREDAEGVRGGARLAEALEALKAQDARYADIAVQRMPCLFACGEHCTVHLRGPGRMGYVLGRFPPQTDAARAILDFAAEYAASEDGCVPYARWPQGVKGHFLVRTPPAGLLPE